MNTVRIYDITRPLGAATAPWPADAPFSIRWRWRLERGNPVNLSSLSLSPHVGTHVDAPLHVREGMEGIGEMNLEPFIGPARVIRVLPDASGRITSASLGSVDLASPPRVLLRTDTCPDPSAWNPAFAALAPETARLLSSRGALLVGVDTPGIDPFTSKDLPAHRILADAGVRWIENLDLGGVEPGVYELVALPLRMPGADASPVRAVLVQR